MRNSTYMFYTETHTKTAPLYWNTHACATVSAARHGASAATRQTSTAADASATTCLNDFNGLIFFAASQSDSGEEQERRELFHFLASRASASMVQPVN